MIKIIDTPLLKKILSSGERYLELNSRLLDNLNVFPVPDGDTGLNMTATVSEGIDEIAKSPISSISDISERLTKSFSENSRGNSGFILSRFFSGFFQVVKDHDWLDADCLASAFSNGAYVARSALVTPVEGTMITIISSMVSVIEEIHTADIVVCFKNMLEGARKTLEETPAMLPVLARAGVVDSGGLGFVFFIEGMYRGLSGQSPELEDEQAYRFMPHEVIHPVPTAFDYRYCVELTVALREEISTAEVKSKLVQLGNSIALVRTGSEIKMHVHTNEPAAVFSLFSGKGTVVRRKIDDIHDQAAAFAAREEGTGRSAVLAIVPGEGFADIFSEFGAKSTMVYQEQLPSAGEISLALEKLDDENIIVLPNDENIIPSARLAAEQSRSNIVIVPSRNIVQGIMAICAFLDDEPFEENLRNMISSMDDCLHVRCYAAAGDSHFDSFSLHAGEYFTIAGNEVLSSGADIVDVIERAFKQSDISARSALTIFYSNEAGEEITKELAAALQVRYDELEITYAAGGQSGALFILAVS